MLHIAMLCFLLYQHRFRSKVTDLVSAYVFCWIFNVVGILSTVLFQLQVVSFIWKVTFLVFGFSHPGFSMWNDISSCNGWAQWLRKPFGKTQNWNPVPYNNSFFFTDFRYTIFFVCVIGTVNILNTSISCYRINCGTTDLFVFILSPGTIGIESIASRFNSSLYVPLVRLFTQLEKIYFDDYRLLSNRF